MNEALLLKYISDNTTKEESSIVEEWIEQSADNKKMAENIFHLYYSMQTVDLMNRIDTEKALDTVKIKMFRNRRKRIFLKLQRVAAILLLPMIGILAYFTYENIANTNDPQYLEVRANQGMISNLTLPDGSKVWLNSGSKIKYPIQFSKERIIELEGEAFFDVTKDQKRNFVVSTKENLSIQVLGTKFNVEAYENQNITTTLIEGEIAVFYNDVEKLLMSPYQKMIYDVKSNEATLKNIHSVSQDIAWKDGEIIFENTSLKEVLYILSKHFDVVFVVDNNKLYDNFFTGKFSNESLDVIIKHIGISSNIRYKTSTSNDKKIVHLY